MGRILLLVVMAAADWSSLDRYQHTITRAEFQSLLTNVYDRTGALTGSLTYAANTVTLATNFTLRFSSSSFVLRPLSFHRIALDPGHIGGEWARMEER